MQDARLAPHGPEHAECTGSTGVPLRLPPSFRYTGSPFLVR